MSIRPYTAKIGVPLRLYYRRDQIKGAVCEKFPGIRVEFSNDSAIRLIGVRASGKEDPAAIISALDQLVQDLAKQKHN